MSINLMSNAARRFESTFKTTQGFPFPATLMPVAEGSIPSYDFSVPRQILRVRKFCPVVTGAMVVGPTGHRFAMAEHDTGIAYDEILYRTHRVFRMNRLVNWEREQSTLDPLTGMEKGLGVVLVKQIWVMDEYVQREEIDLAFRVKEKSRKIITNEPIKEGDILSGAVVTRVDEVLGLNLLELR